MKYKYIIVADKNGKEIPVIFGDELAHAAVFEGVNLGNRRNNRGNWINFELVSAGFVTNLNTPNVGVYGESESLDMLGEINTTSRGSADVLVITGGQAIEAVAKSAAEKHRDMVRDILAKRDPTTKHLSSSQRQEYALEYARIWLPEDFTTLGKDGFIASMRGN
jgi:hypothetical protein